MPIHQKEEAERSYEIFSGFVLFRCRRRSLLFALPFPLILLFLPLLLVSLTLIFLFSAHDRAGTHRTALAGQEDGLTGAGDGGTFRCVADNAGAGTAAHGASVGEPFLLILEQFALKKAGTGTWSWNDSGEGGISDIYCCE